MIYIYIYVCIHLPSEIFCSIRPTLSRNPKSQTVHPAKAALERSGTLCPRTNQPLDSGVLSRDDPHPLHVNRFESILEAPEAMLTKVLHAQGSSGLRGTSGLLWLNMCYSILMARIDMVNLACRGGSCLLSRRNLAFWSRGLAAHLRVRANMSSLVHMWSVERLRAHRHDQETISLHVHSAHEQSAGTQMP